MMRCAWREKPSLVTFTVYSPSGTACRRNSPALSVVMVCCQSDETDLMVTTTPLIGRCWGSCTTPRTFPKMDADADAAHMRTKTTSQERTLGLQAITPPHKPELGNVYRNGSEEGGARPASWWNSLLESSARYN